MECPTENLKTARNLNNFKHGIKRHFFEELKVKREMFIFTCSLKLFNIKHFQKTAKCLQGHPFLTSTEDEGGAKRGEVGKKV